MEGYILSIFRFRSTKKDIDIAVVTSSQHWRAADILAEAEMIKRGESIGEIVRKDSIPLSEIFKDW